MALTLDQWTAQAAVKANQNSKLSLSYSQTAIAKYLRGETLTATQQAQVDKAIKSLGMPPSADAAQESVAQPAETVTVPDRTPVTDPNAGAVISKPVDTTAQQTAAVTPSEAAKSWTLENDPVYQQAMAGGQSSFNRARANALAQLQNQQTQTNQELQGMEQGAAASRQRLAGNYANRGMQRGQYGAYYKAQDKANANLVASQVALKDQLASLSQDFLSNYGAIGTDWTGTQIGQDYKNQATQQAITAMMQRYGL